MGGEAAKERRRLKRIQAKQEDSSEAKTATSKSVPQSKPIDKKNNNPSKTKATEKATFLGPNGANARLRLEKKLARHANRENTIRTDKASSSNPTRKRKSGDVNNQSSTHGKTQQYPQKKIKTSSRSQSTNNHVPKRNASNQNKTSPRNQNNKHHIKKTTKESKYKFKKPKHLKRKMEQLSKIIADGSTVNSVRTRNYLADLEEQMKKLVEQMAQYKKLKETKILIQNKQKRSLQEQNSNGFVVNEDGPSDETLDKRKTTADNDSGEMNSGKIKDGSVNADEVSDSKDGEDSSSSSSSSIKSSGNDSSSDENKEVRFPFESKEKSVEVSASSTSSSSSSSDSDSPSEDEGEIVDPSTDRSRGKRRRGRRENKLKAQTLDNESPDNVSNDNEKPSKELSDPAKERTNNNHNVSSSGALLSSKETPEKDDKRRCIGRKPVTDFVIGKSYSGKVVYIKPQLGAFIDIGCHSDAFCHISCVSDGFVSSVNDVLNINDVVDARVMEVNREKKRITVSLRNDEMALKEMETLKATREYEESLQSRNSHRNGTKAVKSKPGHVRFDADTSESHAELGNKSVNHHISKKITDLKRERKLARRAERRAQREHLDESNEEKGNSNEQQDVVGIQSNNQQRSVSSGQKSGADLKRERKLARRAERRAQREAKMVS